MTQRRAWLTQIAFRRRWKLIAPSNSERNACVITQLVPVVRWCCNLQMNMCRYEAAATQLRVPAPTPRVDCAAGGTCCSGGWPINGRGLILAATTGSSGAVSKAVILSERDASTGSFVVCVRLVRHFAYRTRCLISYASPRQVPRPQRFVPHTLKLCRLFRPHGSNTDDLLKESVSWCVSQAAMDDFPMAQGGDCPC